MKIEAYKDEPTGKVFEDLKEYNKYVYIRKAVSNVYLLYPKVEDNNCTFANGKFSVQRSEEWLNNYKNLLIQKLKETNEMPVGEPFAYTFMRCLCDTGSQFYGPCCRVLDVCKKCFKEWGQQYYADNCCSKG